MTLGESFDSVLLAARSGADWAWTALYRDLSPVVLGYLRARRTPEPEDLLGEVFLHVVRNVPGFTGDERAFRTWVLTIAHRRLVDDLRQRTRRPVAPVADDVLAEAGLRGDAEDEGIHRVEARRAIRAIQALSPEQQEVVLLRLVADLTVEEVAEIVGKRPGAVKALQRRGLAALRKQLLKEGVPL